MFANPQFVTVLCLVRPGVANASALESSHTGARTNPGNLWVANYSGGVNGTTSEISVTIDHR